MSSMSQKLDVATTRFLMKPDVNLLVRGRVLDVGCGSKPYKQFFPDCDWAGLDARPVGEIEADIHEYEGEGFDTVVCLNVLQEIAEPYLAVERMAAALHEGGHLLITAPNTQREDGVTLWSFPAQGLALLCQAAGLKPLSLRCEGGLIRTEYDAWLASSSSAPMMPAEFEGWLDEMNRDYPILSAVVAVK